jgi:hypothetical protein
LQQPPPHQFPSEDPSSDFTLNKTSLGANVSADSIADASVN